MTPSARAAGAAAALAVAAALALPALLAPAFAAAPRGPMPLAAFELPFALADCDYAEFTLKAAPAKLAPHVPAPFKVRESGASAPAGLGGTVVLGAGQCASASAGNQSGPVAFSWFDILVEPLDPALEAPGVSSYLWRAENFVLDDLYGGLMAATFADRAVLDAIAVDVNPAFASFDAEGAGADHHGFGPVGEPGPTGMPVNVPFREYGPAQGGFSYVHAVLTASSATRAGAGVLEAPPGSVAEQVFGSPTSGLYNSGHGFSFGPSPRMGFLPYP